MKLIILNGSSCSGKSTIVKNIMAERDNLFLLHHDSLKWSFSKYSSDKHYKDVQKVMLAVASSVFQMEKYDVICDSGLYKESRQNLINLAREQKYEIIEINLEADYEILTERFDQRVKSALLVPEKDRRIANLSKDRFKELFDIFNNEKNLSAITFRTDKQTIEEVSKNVLNLL